VATSGYGTEYARQIRAVGYCPVGDEVIPSNPSIPQEYVNQVTALLAGVKTECVHLCRVESNGVPYDM